MQIATTPSTYQQIKVIEGIPNYVEVDKPDNLRRVFERQRADPFVALAIHGTPSFASALEVLAAQGKQARQGAVERLAAHIEIGNPGDLLRTMQALHPDAAAVSADASRQETGFDYSYFYPIYLKNAQHLDQVCAEIFGSPAPK